jgi:hypothetical protein
MKLLLASLSLVSFSLFVGCSSRRPSTALEVPRTGRADEPAIAIDSDDNVIGTWAIVDDTNGTADVVFARYRKAESRWVDHVRVNPSLRSSVAGQQVGPRLAVSPSGRIAICWIDRGTDAAGDVMISVSDDGGTTFSSPCTVNDDDKLGRGQEYQDIAIGKDGEIYVVWLDERDAPESYRNQKQLYLATSTDGGRTFDANVALSRSPSGVCPCCRPSVTVGDDGSAHVVYRDREGDSLFIKTRSKSPTARGFSPAVSIATPWRFLACPVNSPQIAAGSNGEVWVLWVDESEGKGALRWARSRDGGREFTIRARVAPTDDMLVQGATHLGLSAASVRGAIATWENAMGQVCAATIPCHGAPESLVPVIISGDVDVVSRSPAITATVNSIGLCWVDDSPEPTTAPRVDGVRPPRLDLFAWSRIEFPESSD